MANQLIEFKTEQLEDQNMTKRVVSISIPRFSEMDASAVGLIVLNSSISLGFITTWYK